MPPIIASYGIEPSLHSPRETERKGPGRRNAWPESCFGSLQWLHYFQAPASMRSCREYLIGMIVLLRPSQNI
jgi:hypothetical protein